MGYCVSCAKDVKAAEVSKAGKRQAPSSKLVVSKKAPKAPEAGKLTTQGQVLQQQQAARAATTADSEGSSST